MKALDYNLEGLSQLLNPRPPDEEDEAEGEEVAVAAVAAGAAAAASDSAAAAAADPVILVTAASTESDESSKVPFPGTGGKIFPVRTTLRAHLVYVTQPCDVGHMTI